MFHFFLHKSLNCSSYIIFSTINVFSDPVYTDGSFTYVRSAAGWKEVKLPTGLSSYLRTLFSKLSSSQIVWSNFTICWYLTWNWLNFCTYFIYFFEILTFKGRKMQLKKNRPLYAASLSLCFLTHLSALYSFSAAISSSIAKHYLIEPSPSTTWYDNS